MITISYLNFWKDPDNDKWLSKFIEHNIGLIKHVNVNSNPDILICSVNGNILNVINCKAKIKIFYTGENLNRYYPYNNLKLLQKVFNLIIGFNYTNLKEKIIRLPLWFLYYPYYSMNDSKNNLLTYLNDSYKKNINKNKTIFATCVSRHDRGGQRTLLYNELSKYGKIMCPSKFKNNTTLLSIGYKNKINYISNGRYNICPENSINEGYHTEKIFHALEAGTIPIYWGVDLPEKDLINKNCYCFVNIKDKKDIETKINDIIVNKKKYIVDNIFTVDAEKILKKYYDTLKDEIKKLLK